MEAPPKGPYVQAALFADMVIEDKSGTLSAIRIIDRMTHSVVGPDAPSEMPPVNRQLAALISLKSGEARGRQNFKLTMEAPDGLVKDVVQGNFHFDASPSHGVNLNFNIAVSFTQEGVYWFSFAVEDQILTRMPFEVRYSRLMSTGGPAQG